MKPWVRFLLAALVVTFLVLLSPTFAPRDVRAVGPWYVATTGDDTNNDCLTPSTPCASINGALAKPGFADGDTIKVAIGTYYGTGSEVVLLNRSATLSGGWDASFTAQNGMSTIDGQGARRGVTVSNSVTTTIEYQTIQNGYAREGAGIANWGNLTLNNTNVANNSAYPQDYFSDWGGGGISNHSALLLNNSTVSKNSVTGGFPGSGIISINAVTTTLNNSTVSDNIGTYGFGGGIALWNSVLNLNNVTIFNNQPTGLRIDYISGAFVKNSIISGNMGSDCANIGGGGFASLGYNLIGRGYQCPLATNDISTFEPKLDILQNNGGRTLTHALLPNSPAINAGDSAGCIGSVGMLMSDQRGFPRFGRCDIGSYELQPIGFSTKSVNVPNILTGSLVTYTITLSNPSNIYLSNVFVTDSLPNNLSYANGSLTSPVGDYGYASGVITWTGSVDANSSVGITFGAIPHISALERSLITNSATISGGGEILTRSANIQALPQLVFMPLIEKNYSPPRTLIGRVTLNGTGMPGIYLELRFYNGSSWSTVATTNTVADGSYSFVNAPGLSPGQYYYVRYLNGSDSNRLCCWSTRLLDSSNNGQTVAAGNFDLANISLQAPAPGAHVTLPQQFQWTVRPGIPTDSYELDLYDPGNQNTSWYTPPLGYVGSYNLSSLPGNLSYGWGYGWYVGVYSPDGGYGASYWAYLVTFENSGGSNNPIRLAPSKLRPQENFHPKPNLKSKP